MSPATIDIGPAVVANHRRFAPVEALVDVLKRFGPQTADEIGSHLELSTRDVVATLNVLAAYQQVYLYSRPGEQDDQLLRDADLVVLRRSDATGEVIKDSRCEIRYVSVAQMAVLEAHRPVVRRVPTDDAGQGRTAVWSLR